MALEVVPAEAEAQEEAEKSELDGEELDRENTLEAPDSQSAEEEKPQKSAMSTRFRRSIRDGSRRKALKATRAIRKRTRIWYKVISK